MSYEFLRRLFTSCGEEPSNGFPEGTNLSELYEKIEETRKEDSAFTEVVEGTGLDFDAKQKLEDACCDVGNAHELQGFINGFRICAMLRGEVPEGGARRAGGS